MYSHPNTYLKSLSALFHFQSSCRKFNSTETALLSFQNEPNLAMNKLRVSAPILLNFSAAFDTNNHDILLNILNSCVSIADSAFSLLSPYLIIFTLSYSLLISYYRLRIFFYATASSWCPQGSVLGPLLFSLYTTPLSFL